MKYYLSILAIFKNEGHCINEWLEHYINEGVEHFYLIDNGSTDNYKISSDKIDLVIDHQPYDQAQKYNNYYLNKSKEESEWVLVVDLDEFVYARKNYKTISEYLQSLADNIQQVGIPWKMFSSSGHISQPSSLTNSFLYRHQKEGIIETKCIVRTRYLKQYDLHCSKVMGETLYITGEFYDATPFKYISEYILKMSPLHLNHYQNQSFEWYESVKMTRGDADGQKNTSTRNIKAFNVCDGEISRIDDELCNKYHKKHVFTDDIIVYGAEGKYHDITNFIIYFDKSFNEQFGDPIPGRKKYLIVRKNHRLYVYDEI